MLSSDLMYAMVLPCSHTRNNLGKNMRILRGTRISFEYLSFLFSGYHCRKHLPLLLVLSLDMLLLFYGMKGKLLSCTQFQTICSYSITVLLFLYVAFISCYFAKFIYSHSFLAEYLRFSMYTIISSENNEKLTAYFPVWCLFLLSGSFGYNFSTRMNKIGKTWQFFLVLS